MFRRAIALAMFLLAPAAARAAEPAPAPAPPGFGRSEAERVIAAKFPGFRILTTQDFLEWLRPSLADGMRGGFVTGRFDLDEHVDFAAYIVPPTTKRHEYSGGGGYDDHEGKLVTCHGGAAGDAFRCAAQERRISLPLSQYLERIPPGTHACLAEGDRVVVTTIDSLGWSFPEKGSGFTFLRPDGTEEECLTGD